MDVVIPAHNEAAAIVGCLAAVDRSADIGSIVVVANGCTDTTAEVARMARTRASVTVVETSRPGKALALNLGDAGCTGFPRAYVDADVEISAGSLDALGAALRRSDAQLAVPEVRLDDVSTSRLVRAYLRVWRELPAVRLAGAGRGVYVLSAVGHERVFPLPGDLLSDDGYVDRVVGRAGALHVADAVTVVRGPRTLRILVRRRLRVLEGNRQLRSLGLPPVVDGSGGGQLVGLCRVRRVRLGDGLVFAAIAVLVRALDVVRRLRGPRRHGGWSTSR